MIALRPKRFVKWLSVTATAVTSVVLLTATPALAASAAASRDNFDRSGQCDAVVIVSTNTSFGNVEVFGGFACPTGSGLFNKPLATTIKVMIIRNGAEVIRNTRPLPTCNDPLTCSSDSNSVTLPNEDGDQSYSGRMEITSPSGHVDLTTDVIRV